MLSYFHNNNKKKKPKSERKKKRQNFKKCLGDFGDNNKLSNIQIIGVPER